MGQIKANQKVELIFKMADNSIREIYCLVKEAYSDRIALTSSGDVIEYANYLSEGEELTVKIFTPQGVKVFDTIILDSPLEPEFVIEYSETATDIQRREFVRIELELKVVIQKEDKTNLVTRTINVSGGGLRFYSEGSFTPQEIVNITLYMPEDRAVQAKGTIIANEFLPKNEYVLSFTEIQERERDRIIKKCFEAQTNRY